MQLEATLTDVVGRLRQGRFPNEQAISQGIVLRVLQELGWDTWDTTAVWPEYQTGGGRVDFALCHPLTKPAVFIEVKQPGRAEDSVRQALEYAFHTGVPFIVLTDGQTWSFYLPAEQGSYEDRRVYKLDLFERQHSEAAGIISQYLARDNVSSGKSLEIARNEYRRRNRRSIAKSTIPEAWHELVEKGDEYLIDIIASAVETKAGIRPNDDDVTEFLADLGKRTLMNRPTERTKEPEPLIVPRPPRRPTDTPRAGQLRIRNKSYSYNNAKEALVTLLRELANEDKSFLERCSQRSEIQGRKRQYIARTAEELYPDRPDLREYRESLPGGWFVSNNLNNALKKSIMKVACEVAGLVFGKDVIVEF